MRPDPRVVAAAAEVRAAADLAPAEVWPSVVRVLHRAGEADWAGYYRLAWIDGAARFTSWAALGPTRGGRAVLDTFAEHPELLDPSPVAHPERIAERETRSFLEIDSIVPLEQLRRSRAHELIFDPFGVADQQRLLVFHGSRFVAWVGLGRERGQPLFTRRDRYRMQPLASAVIDTLVLADHRERAAVPDAPGDLLARADGRVEYASQQGLAWLVVPGFRTALTRALREVDRARQPLSARFSGPVSMRIVRVEGGGRVRYAVMVARAAPMLRPTASLLAPRQREIAEMAAAGASVREIAAALGISRDTVKAHLRRIYQRLDVASRLELRCALQRGGGAA